ncbi:MAG: hypothetical protein LBH11_07905 [Propionibacteriaceae bacterium]|nr:hypothetical protein [Propionibacteriaceae bacterium]
MIRDLIPDPVSVATSRRCLLSSLSTVIAGLTRDLIPHSVNATTSHRCLPVTSTKGLDLLVSLLVVFAIVGERF